MYAEYTRPQLTFLALHSWYIYLYHVPAESKLKSFTLKQYHFIQFFLKCNSKTLSSKIHYREYILKITIFQHKILDMAGNRGGRKRHIEYFRCIEIF